MDSSICIFFAFIVLFRFVFLLLFCFVFCFLPGKKQKQNAKQKQKKKSEKQKKSKKNKCEWTSPFVPDSNFFTLFVFPFVFLFMLLLCFLHFADLLFVFSIFLHFSHFFQVLKNKNKLWFGEQNHSGEHWTEYHCCPVHDLDLGSGARCPWRYLVLTYHPRKQHRFGIAVGYWFGDVACSWVHEGSQCRQRQSPSLSC